MANTLTLSGLTELLYQAKDVVANEPVALVDSVLINSGSEGVSTNGTVTSFKTSAPSVTTTYTPSMSLPSSQDLTVTTDTMTLGQVASVTIPLEGEILKQLENTAGRDNVVNNLLAQGIRSLRNTIEAHIASVIYKGASRAYGTAGTTPFASNHNAVNAIRQILFDNGCPMNDGQISLVMDSLAGTNLRNLSNLYKVNESGDSTLLRRGILQDISGIMLKESSGIGLHTAGTNSGGTTDNAGYAIGSSTLTLASAGTGTILAGDIITLAGDTNKYVVKTGDADVSGGGSIVIGLPGLKKAASAATKAITTTADYTANVAFHRSAVELAMRPPAAPSVGDAGEHSTIADTKTGLVFDAGVYRGDGMAVLRLITRYQAKVWKPEFCAVLIG